MGCRCKSSSSQRSVLPPAQASRELGVTRPNYQRGLGCHKGCLLAISVLLMLKDVNEQLLPVWNNMFTESKPNVVFEESW